jgi:hypothetical protein
LHEQSDQHTSQEQEPTHAYHPTIPCCHQQIWGRKRGIWKEQRQRKRKWKWHRNSQHSPFKYRNKVQCEACKTSGHCIGNNVCRIAAQVHHVSAYTEKAPDNAKKNASAFAMTNNKATIKLVKANFPDTFHDGITEEEEDYTIYQMARMMQPDSDME